MRLYNNRDGLYQWDSNQYVVHNFAIGDEVHFFNMTQPNALTVRAFKMNGEVVAEIPNILLQSSYPIYVYWMKMEQDGQYTKEEFVLKVKQRPKPAGYMYTETEVLSYAYLDKRLDYLEGDGLKAALAAYLEEHPLEESDPTVPEWAKQPEKPEYTAEEVGAVGKDELPEAINEALAQAKASGEFDGKDGAPGKDGADGKDYVLTPEDLTEIAEQAAELVDVPEGSGAVSGTLLPETEVAPETHVPGFGHTSTSVGAKMAVIIDDTPYITTHKAIGEGLDASDYIGNIAISYPETAGTEYDTGEPFFGYMYAGGTKFSFADGASHKVAICTVDVLDEVYIRALNSLESGEAKEKTDTLTFDGNLENVEKVSVNDVYYFVKLYDGFVERSELVGGTVTLSDNTVRNLTEDNLVDNTENYGVPGYQIGNGVGIAVDGTLTMDGITLTRGIWCVYTQQSYVKELKAPKAIFDAETEDSAPGNFIVELTTADGENFTVNKTYEEIVTAWGDGLRVLAMMAGEPITIPLTGLDTDKGDLIFEMSGGIFEGAEMTVMLTCSPGNEWSLIPKAIPTMETVERLAGELMTGVAKVPTAEVGQTIKIKSVDDNGVPTAWEAVDFPSGGVQADWNQNDSNAPDYVKNRPFWTGDPVETLLFEGDVREDDDINIPLLTGEEYIIYLDEKEYRLIAFELDGFVVIGSVSLWTGDEYDETEPPFVIGGGWFYTVNTGGRHSLKVVHNALEMHKIDDGYLPSCIVKFTNDGNGNWISNQSPNSVFERWLIGTRVIFEIAPFSNGLYATYVIPTLCYFNVGPIFEAVWDCYDENSPGYRFVFSNESITLKYGDTLQLPD